MLTLAQNASPVPFPNTVATPTISPPAACRLSHLAPSGAARRILAIFREQNFYQTCAVLALPLRTFSIVTASALRSRPVYLRLLVHAHTSSVLPDTDFQKPVKLFCISSACRFTYADAPPRTLQNTFTIAASEGVRALKGRFFCVFACAPSEANSLAL